MCAHENQKKYKNNHINPKTLNPNPKIPNAVGCRKGVQGGCVFSRLHKASLSQGLDVGLQKDFARGYSEPPESWNMELG